LGEALEMTRAERIATAAEVAKDTAHAFPLMARLRNREADIVRKRRISVRGRTKRCLYLAARVSVADLFEAVASAEEDVDGN
jgi:hypothetical protein